MFAPFLSMAAGAAVTERPPNIAGSSLRSGQPTDPGDCRFVPYAPAESEVLSAWTRYSANSK